MRARSLALVASLVLAAGCGSDGAGGAPAVDAGAGGTSNGGSGGSGGSSAGGAGGGSSGTGGSGGAATQCPGRLDPVAASGTTKTVGTGSAASCTEQALRDAVDALKAEGGGTILFDCGGKHTITVTSRLIAGTAKDKTLIVDGKGDITISGGGTTRIFDLDNHTNFVVQRLSLIDGFVPAGEPEETNKPPNSGAAIRHPWFGTLKAIDVRFENNHCASMDGEIGGGAIYAGGLTEAVLSGCEFVNNSASNGGGILNRGSTLTIVDCGFRGNGALSTGDGQYGNGGGVYIDGMNYENPGGDFMLCGTVFEGNTGMTHGSGMFSYFYEGSSSVIRDCVFNANKFGNAAKGSGALYHEAAPLTLTGTTFSNHQTGEHAGAIFLGQKSEADITNCTFANNKVVSNGGALFNGAAIAHFTSCTFSGNDADYGPAIFKGKSATVTLKNTIFANNTTANQYSATSCHEAMTDQGGNLQWPQVKKSGNPDQPCVEGITFADPLLAPLADNGGVSQTFALGAGSPAINLATDCPATDQRGKPRSTPCDSGAFEVQP
ncbi:MAG: right-handed parallel beta-helix repeat-containing protein [Deltaproteobacteria bacterium]|nr:right-handed parallel beta-helix repeat-containing protein [Deltaproteobacteria bacterium]